MRLLFTFVCLWALFTSTTAIPIRDDEFEVDSNFIQDIEKPSSFSADPDEFFKMVNFSSTHPELVFGGQEARPGQFPQQAFLLYKSTDGYYHGCGASLLSTTLAVTAGHCTFGMISPAEIMVGSTNRIDQSEKAQRRNITGTYTHPGHDPKARPVRDDIGIVRFSPPITLNKNVQLAKIVADDSQLLQSHNAFLSGFGTYTYRGNNTVTSDNLLWAQLQLFNWTYCHQLRPTLDPRKNQICAGSRGKGGGPGDSGGPLQVASKGQLYQIGVASFVSSDKQDQQYNQDKHPTVFTRLASYCQLLAKVTRGAFRCEYDEPRVCWTPPDCG
uniref:Elastase n=1 Tax=Steinernema carpocapsae TaxID=34508 RepID=Q0GK32_STECR|nr:elastase precursor [Steinernema carpocapsae]